MNWGSFWLVLGGCLGMFALIGVILVVGVWIADRFGELAAGCFTVFAIVLASAVAIGLNT